MVKIDPYFDDAPPQLSADASKKHYKSKHNPNGDAKIDLALSQRSAHDFDINVYGSTVVKDKLKTIFNYKCGFCETNTHVGAHKDIEHFRFKKHYYWLGYEWSNLLVSCQICNRDFKKTQFPLENDAHRMLMHPLSISGDLDTEACHILRMNTVEQPLLLHPAIDDPDLHLQFLENGFVNGMTTKGTKSINVYGLNREPLTKARLKIVQELRQEIWEEYLEKDTLNDRELITEIRKVINRLKKRIANNQEYTAFASTILAHFDTFIIDNQDLGIDMPDKERMREIAKILINP